MTGSALIPRPEAPPPAPGPSRRWLPWVGVPLAWLVVALVWSSRGGRAIGLDGEVTVIPWQDTVVDNLVAFGWWAVLTPPVVFVVRRLDDGRRPLALRVAGQILAAGVFILAYFALRTGIRFPWLHFQLARGWPGLSSILPEATMVYGVMLGATLALAANQRSRQREREATALALRATQLQAELVGARLQVLRAQLHPHFLFNALHAISTLVDWRPEEARRMLARLSELLRLAVEATEQAEIPLTREVEWLERYLELQQIRYEERLEVELRISPEALGARVPPLILQPLLENAIKYAVDPRPSGARIVLSAERDGERLRLRVSDDGPGPAPTPPESGGLGLRNTRERLRAVYGDAQFVELRPAEGGGAEALIEIPYREAGVPALAAGEPA
jgi:two-component system, LytTR family, sensor kinase